MAIEGQGADTPECCDFCRLGTVIRRIERLRFSQRTNRGTVHCRVWLPIGQCNTCVAAHLDSAGEARIEAEVLHAYLKLRPT